MKYFWHAVKNGWYWILCLAKEMFFYQCNILKLGCHVSIGVHSMNVAVTPDFDICLKIPQYMNTVDSRYKILLG